MPANTVRWCVPPRLTVSLSSFFAVGTSSAASTRATRRSTLANSSIVICGAHKRRMAGNFPFGRSSKGHGSIPREVNDPFTAARAALHSFEQMMKESAHVEAR